MKYYLPVPNPATSYLSPISPQSLPPISLPVPNPLLHSQYQLPVPNQPPNPPPNLVTCPQSPSPFPALPVTCPQSAPNHRLPVLQSQSPIGCESRYLSPIPFSIPSASSYLSPITVYLSSNPNPQLGAELTATAVTCP